MGLVKSYMMEQQEEHAYEEKLEWIREKLDNYEADELTDGWDEAEEEYERYLNFQSSQWRDEEYEDYLQSFQDNWTVEGKTNFQIFNEIIGNSQVISALSVYNPQVRKNLFVMVYGHIVAAVEAYLSSTFINNVMSSEVFLRKLVENDPIFASRKFTIAEIFTKKEQLDEDVKSYLRGLMFHDIKKIKPMYKDVLDIDFGKNLKWLFEAVKLRHDCVHRAGYDKDGNEVDLDKEKIENLIKECQNLVNMIEDKITTLHITL